MIPFFIEKIINVFPRVHLKRIKNDNNSDSLVMHLTRDGRIPLAKYQSVNPPYVKPSIDSYLVRPPRPRPNPTPPIGGWRCDCSIPHVQMETLDGSEYLLCKHGKRIL